MILSSRSISSIVPYIKRRFWSMVRVDTCTNPVGCSTSGDRKTGSTVVMICFLKALSTAVYFRTALDFLEIINCEGLFLGVSHGWQVIDRVVRRRKRETCLCHVFLACHCQREVSMPASSKVRQHRCRIPTEQYM